MKMVNRAAILMLALVIGVSSGSEAKGSGRLILISYYQAQERYYFELSLIVYQEPKFKSHHELIPIGFKDTGASISSVKK